MPKEKKVEYRKDFKELYLPKTKPAIIKIPSINFATISGAGNPNGEEFNQKIEALYAFSYAVKMSYKGLEVPEGYYQYTVFPLEGVWDLLDKSKSATDKDNFVYNIMIRQPDFLTNELFNKFVEIAKNKKKNPELDNLKFETIDEGLCCQMMHLGSYDDEPASFELMEKFCQENGYERVSKIHREIYLSDPRKVTPDKLKTVLRFKVKELKN